MPVRPQIELMDELKKMNREIRIMKNYLKTLIKLNLEQIREVEPTPDEKRILKEPIKDGDFLEWEEVKDEI